MIVRSATVLGILVMVSACTVVPVPVVEIPPTVPTPYVEYVPVPPGPPHVWVPGYWAWRHPGYVWVPGRYAVPPAPAYVWIPPYWAPTVTGSRRRPPWPRSTRPRSVTVWDDQPRRRPRPRRPDLRSGVAVALPASVVMSRLAA